MASSRWWLRETRSDGAGDTKDRPPQIVRSRDVEPDGKPFAEVTAVERQDHDAETVGK